MRQVTRATVAGNNIALSLMGEAVDDAGRLAPSWALVRDQARSGDPLLAACLRHATGINPCRDARDRRALRTFGPSCSGCDRRRLIDGAGGGRGTVMKRISTLAGMAASPASASLSVVSLSAGDSAAPAPRTVAPAELDAASTGRFDVLCTDMLVPMAPIDKVARYESRVGDNHHHVGGSSGFLADVAWRRRYQPLLERVRRPRLRDRRGRGHALGLCASTAPPHPVPELTP